MKETRTRRKLRAGQALLEFALTLPVLMLMILGVMAFGQVYSHQLILNNATREGARAGTTGSADLDITTVLQDRTKMLPNYTDPNYMEIFIDPPQGAANRVKGNPLTVQLRYKDYIAAPIVGIFVNPKTLMSRTTMRVES